MDGMERADLGAYGIFLLTGAGSNLPDEGMFLRMQETIKMMGVILSQLVKETSILFLQGPHQHFIIQFLKGFHGYPPLYKDKSNPEQEKTPPKTVRQSKKQYPARSIVLVFFQVNRPEG